MIVTLCYAELFYLDVKPDVSGLGRDLMLVTSSDGQTGSSPTTSSVTSIRTSSVPVGSKEPSGRFGYLWFFPMSLEICDSYIVLSSSGLTLYKHGLFIYKLIHPGC